MSQLGEVNIGQDQGQVTPSLDGQGPDWQTWRNDSKETCPGFGLIYLDYKDGDYFAINDQLPNTGEVMWIGKKPNADAQAFQDPNRHRINGPTAVEPGGYGVCSAAFPLQALHDGERDKLPNMYSCGPRDDSWYVWSGGGAFTCLTHDGCNAIKKGSVHSVWIAPNFKDNPAFLFSSGFNVTLDVADGKNIPLEGEYLSSLAYGNIKPNDRNGSELKGMTVTNSGYYLLNLTILAQFLPDSDPEAEYNTTYNLKFNIFATENDPQTQDYSDPTEKDAHIFGETTQVPVVFRKGALIMDFNGTVGSYNIQANQETYPFHNISGTGVIELKKKNMTVFARTSSPYKMRITKINFTLFKIGEYIDKNPPGKYKGDKGQVGGSSGSSGSG